MNVLHRGCGALASVPQRAAAPLDGGSRRTGRARRTDIGAAPVGCFRPPNFGGRGRELAMPASFLSVPLSWRTAAALHFGFT
eukprot:CAMPEP_0170301424 /NCGR_PEP_ID=MMETSP0116_2-20130129/50973_1 /TAXON_ID=400756 /ORGANISM="Durinskia baltica, Strain CSIRO CS-38" /LENGTH=81 /DNA_ID=CAMNT_0010553249 /DNA_START=120 /DNA_END=361 /DNA_ORIENTATION=-